MMLNTPEQIDYYRMCVLIRSISLYLKTGMKLTRVATPARMRELATEYTGNKYARSTKGLQSALNDLEAIKAKAELKAQYA